MELNFKNIAIILVVAVAAYYLWNKYGKKESKYSEGQLDGGDFLNLQTGQRMFTKGDI